MRCLTKRGSITVESAIVMPIFIFFILTIAYIMSFVRLQSMVQSGITQAAMDSAKNAYGEQVLNQGLYSGVESLISTVNTGNIIKDKAGTDFLNNSGVANGAAGLVTITDSLTTENEVKVSASYTYSPAFNIFGIRNIFNTQTAISRKWTGDDLSDSATDEEIVYIARTGTVYHKTPNCTHINLDIRQVDGSSLDRLRNNEGAKYYYCERCSKGVAKVGSFYITPYGDAYHVNADCSGLKRDVSAIALSQVGDRRACSRCYAGN